MSIIVQQHETIYTFIIFLQTAVHVSDDTLIHHQEHMQIVITASGTGRTGTAVPTHPRHRTVANTVRTVPDVVITVWMCSWWWYQPKHVELSAENIIKLYIVATCWTIIDIGILWTVNLLLVLIQTRTCIDTCTPLYWHCVPLTRFGRQGTFFREYDWQMVTARWIKYVHQMSNSEIESGLKSGNACCHTVQNVLCSGLLSKNVEI